MQTKARITLLMSALVLVFVASCSEKGPAEKAGERIDSAVEDVKDAVDPAGPAEKAGRQIDETVEKLEDKD